MTTRKSPDLLKSVIILGAATVIAKLTGFAREVIIAGSYGVGTFSDAIILAFTIPETLLMFISAPVIASFIPMYHRVDNKVGFSRNIMTCLLLIGLVFSAVFTLVPEVTVRLFAFNLAPETFELTVFFVRYMVWTAIFMLLTDIYSARLEIEGAFFYAGIRSIWRNVIVIIGLILGAVFDYNLFIALSTVVGNALCMFVVAMGCRKHGYVYRPFLDIHSPELKHLLILCGPVLLSKASLQINLIINRNFAASLPDGTISYLHYSHRVAVLIVALFGHALFIVLYPHMSKLAADGDFDRLKNTISQGIVYIMALMLPLCIGMVILAQPGIRILFQRGSFTTEDTIFTAACLRMYAPLLIFTSLSSLLMRAFYAIQNTKIPAVVSFVTVIASLGLNFILIRPLGAEGLALAVSVSGLFATGLLLFCLHNKLGSMGLKKHLPELLKITLASCVMGAGIWFVSNMLPIMSVPIWQSVLLCTLLVLVATLLYFLVLFFQRSKIVYELVSIVKLRRKN